MTKETSLLRPEKIGFEGDPIILPNGLEVDGEIYQETDLSELLSKDIKQFGSTEFKQNPGLGLSKLLRRRIERIGDFEPPSPNQINNLLTGDREYVLMKLRQISLGDKVVFDVRCPLEECKAQFSSNFNISDVEIKYGTGERVLDIELKRGFIDSKGVVHTKVVLNMATGKEQEGLPIKVRKNLIDVGDWITAHCLVKVGSIEGEELRKKCTTIIDEITRRDRIKIDDAIAKALISPDGAIELECPECGYEFEAPFPFATFFIEKPRT